MSVQTINAFAQYPAGACSQTNNPPQCIDATPCKNDSNGEVVCLAGTSLPQGAFQLTQTCWEYSYSYVCNTNSVNTCTVYEADPKCSIISSSCSDNNPYTNTCIEWLYTYQCETTPPVTEEVATCSNNLGIASMPTPNNVNANFAKMAISMEMASQGTTYIDGGMLFGGVRESCSKGEYGLYNCCTSAGGAQSNSAVANVLTSMGLDVIMYLGQSAVDMASPYIFDAMYNNDIWTQGMTESYGAGGTNLTSGGFSIGAYGFTYSTVAPAAGSGVMGANTTYAINNGTGGYITFNPYVFAAMVVITYVQSLQECSTEEQMLSMHRGANLSHFLDPPGEQCVDEDVFGHCTEYRQSYCSFNSVLAKIINIQGKRQLGQDINDCAGIPIGELANIDFSIIDFGEFIPKMTNYATSHYPSSSEMNSNYTPVLDDATKGSQQNRTNADLPAYPQ